MRKLLFAVAALLSIGDPAWAQNTYPSDNRSTAITTGNTFQTIIANSTPRKSLTVQNNNTNNDNCWVDVTGTVAAGNTTATSVTVLGGTITSAQASVLLAPGGSYQRYYPYLPRGAIVATCAANGDSLYVDIQ